MKKAVFCIDGTKCLSKQPDIVYSAWIKKKNGKILKILLYLVQKNPRRIYINVFCILHPEITIVFIVLQTGFSSNEGRARITNYIQRNSSFHKLWFSKQYIFATQLWTFNILRCEFCSI